MRFKKILGIFPMAPSTGWRFRVMAELEYSEGETREYGAGRPVADVLCGHGRLEAGSTGFAGRRGHGRLVSCAGLVEAVRGYLDRKGIIY